MPELAGMVFVLALPVLLGGLIARPFHRFSGWNGWLAAGTVTGFSLFSVGSFLLTLVIGPISWNVIAGANLLLLLAAGISRRLCLGSCAEPWPLRFPDSRPLAAVCAVAGLVLVAVIVGSFREVLHVRPDGVFIGFYNNFGDLGLHIHYMASFLQADTFPPPNPIFAGDTLRYPFLCDFFSATLWFATGNLEISLELPGTLLCLSIFIMLYQWIWALTDDPIAGMLAAWLFFFCGSTGFLFWLGSLAETGGPFSPRFPQGFSLIPAEGLHWPNVIHALLIPQRGFQMAIPLVVLALSIVIENAPAPTRAPLLFAAILVAGMPFIHGHSVVALAITGLLILICFPDRKWIWLVVPAALFWLPQTLYLLGSPSAGSSGTPGFFRLINGWMGQGLLSPWFWLKNTGLFLPAVCFFFLNGPANSSGTRILGISGGILFLLGNIVAFAPWDWDNTKILIYWYLFALPLLTHGLASWLQSRQPRRIALALTLTLSLSLTGMIDLAHALIPGGEDYLIYHRIPGNDELKIADWLREHTSKRSILLTHPSVNQPVQLSGRTVVMGYPGHIWSHNLPLEPRAGDCIKMLQGKEEAKRLLAHYGVTFVICGPREKNAEPAINQGFFDQIGERCAELEGTVIYRLSPPGDHGRNGRQ